MSGKRGQKGKKNQNKKNNKPNQTVQEEEQVVVETEEKVETENVEIETPKAEEITEERQEESNEDKKLEVPKVEEKQEEIEKQTDEIKTVPQAETPTQNTNESQEAAKPVEEKETEKRELDPRAQVLNSQLINLLNAAQGIWKDALESQVRLTVKADYLQESLDQIKQYSALPNYPAGLKQLQNSINRVQICKKRIIAVQNRLAKLNAILNPPKPKN